MGFIYVYQGVLVYFIEYNNLSGNKMKKTKTKRSAINGQYDNGETSSYQKFKKADIKQNIQHQRDMENIIKPLELRTFKAYPFVITVMAVIQMLCIIYGRHITDIFGVGVALGNLVFTPMLFYIFQIVAECYGWQYSRQIVWCNFTVNGMITLFSFAFSFVPYSALTHTDLQYSYQHLVDKMWFSAMINWVTIFAIDYLSTVVMCRTRSIYKGEGLLFRLILVHLMSEVISCSGGAFAYWYNNYSVADIWTLQYHAFIARTISAIVLIPFVMTIIWFIQDRIERVIAFDTGRDLWNIFHWNINPKNIVQFDVKEWSRLSAIKRKRIDINKIALDYYTDDKLGIDKMFKNKPKDNSKQL